MILVINQITELLSEKEKINYEKLAQKLNIKVFFISTLTGEGIQDLKGFILSEAEVKADSIQDPELISELEKALEKNQELNNHFEALMWLEEDKRLLNIHGCEYCDIKPEKNSRQKMYAKRQTRVNRIMEDINLEGKHNIEEIINFVKEKTLLQEINSDTDIWGTGSCVGDDFDELIFDFSGKYKVHIGKYLDYFHTDEEGWNYGSIFFKPPYEQVERIPITPKMLTAFANSGNWNIIYPEHKIDYPRKDLIFNSLLFRSFIISLLLSSLFPPLIFVFFACLCFVVVVPIIGILKFILDKIRGKK